MKVFRPPPCHVHSNLNRNLLCAQYRVLCVLLSWSMNTVSSLKKGVCVDVCGRVHIFLCLWELRAWRHILLLVNYPKRHGVGRKQWEGVEEGWSRGWGGGWQRSDHLEPQVLSNIVSAPYCLSFTIFPFFSPLRRTHIRTQATETYTKTHQERHAGTELINNTAACEHYSTISTYIFIFYTQDPIWD